MPGRARILNISTQTSGIVTTVPTTGAWDLETDLEPRFAKPFPAFLMQTHALVPLPKIVPRGSTGFTDPIFRRQNRVVGMPFTVVPPLPFIRLVANVDTAGGSTAISFASVPGGVSVNQLVSDLTTVGAVVPGTRVVSKTPTLVNIDTPTAAIVHAGDVVYFSW